MRFVTNDKIPRNVKWRVSETREWMDKQNATIDLNISDEIEKIVCILKQLILDNKLTKLQELISHGICEQLTKYCIKNPMDSDNIYDCGLSKIITDIVGLILQHNRIDCLLLLNPFLDLSLFDISNFDDQFESNPLQCIMFLCENYKTTNSTTTDVKALGTGTVTATTGDIVINSSQAKNIQINKTKYNNNINSSIRKSKNSDEFLFDIKCCHCKMLFKCCEAGFYDCVVYCVSKGCDISICRNRAIRDSARFGHLKIVQFLVENGANFHEYREEALRKACRHGHLDIVKYLSQIGCHLNINSKNKKSVSTNTTNNDNSHNTCNNQKSKNRIYPADITVSNFQCIEWALKNGHGDIVEYLIVQCIKMLQSKMIGDIRYIRQDLMAICLNSNHFDKILPLLIHFGFPLLDVEFQKLILNNTYQIDSNTNSSTSNSNSSNSSNSNNSSNNSGNVQSKQQRQLNALWHGYNARKEKLMFVLVKFIPSDDVCNIICKFELLIAQ